MVSLVVEKVIILFSMAAITFIAGMLPLKLFSELRKNNDLRARSMWRTAICICSCFSGGIFLSACLLDLLPEVEEKFEEIKENIKEKYGKEIEYPLAHFVMCCGFFLILIIEQTVLHYQEKIVQEGEPQPLLSDSGTTPPTNAHQRYSYEANDTHDGHGHSHMSHSLLQVNNNSTSSLRSIMLLVALAFHSVFEGIAVGLQDNSSDLISIFIAVICHKSVMAFSLGLNIAQSDLSLMSFFISNVIFSISSPLGVGLGIGIAGMPSSLTLDIINGTLQGIAGGTFLYVTFFEILPHELDVPTKRLMKVSFILLGFGSFCGLLFLSH